MSPGFYIRDFFSEQESRWWKKHQISNIKHQMIINVCWLMIDDWWFDLMMMIKWFNNNVYNSQKLLLNKITNYKLFILMEPSNQPTNQKNIRSDLKNIFLFAFDFFFFFKNLAFLVWFAVCWRLFFTFAKWKKNIYLSLSLWSGWLYFLARERERERERKVVQLLPGIIPTTTTTIFFCRFFSN